MSLLKRPLAATARWIATFGLLIAPVAHAQITSVDPNSALGSRAASAQVAAQSTPPAKPTPPSEDINADLTTADDATVAAPDVAAQAPAPGGKTQTFRRDDLIGAAEGVFGKGAKGLGELMEKILKDQGEPNGYIAGREASGAFVVGLRYGSGTLTHKVEGQRPVYWTGPSVGFDFGGDAANVFVLVYNLYDSQDLYKRFAQVEGRAYFVGGLSATYLRRGNIAMIPIRLGVGVRLGANVGYMKFSEKSRWLPF